MWCEVEVEVVVEFLRRDVAVEREYPSVAEAASDFANTIGCAGVADFWVNWWSGKRKCRAVKCNERGLWA